MYYKMYANIMDTPILDLMDILLSPRDNILWILSIVNSAQLLSFCWVQRLVEWDWTWLEHLIWSCMISTGIQLQIFRSCNSCVHVGWDGHKMNSWLIFNYLTLHVLLLPISHCVWTSTTTRENSSWEEKKKHFSVILYILGSVEALLQ